MFALSAQNKMVRDVHQLVMLLAALLGILSFAAFFYLIDYASRLLRPISILSKVGADGLAVIEGVYPDLTVRPDTRESQSLNLGSPSGVIYHRGTSGIILAVNLDLLKATAERANGVVNWEKFVHLAFSEIRCCGSNSLQVVRRLRAMIENLVQTLPPHRHAALLEQLSLLDREIENPRNFKYPEELALARVADAQGLGGPPRNNSLKASCRFDLSFKSTALQ